jgi:hypothetical protein
MKPKFVYKVAQKIRRGRNLLFVNLFFLLVLIPCLSA